MTILEAIDQRHSVRQYKDIPIAPETAEKLRALISACNEESGLNFKLITDEPKAFDVFLEHYGKFKNAVNYIA